jgi:hypothetical protein
MEYMLGTVKHLSGCLAFIARVSESKEHRALLIGLKAQTDRLLDGGMGTMEASTQVRG